MNYRYGLLKYSTLNIGDDIQSIAARQFLPRVDIYLDRDYLNNVRSEQKIKLIMNGWFTGKPKNWPPSLDIEPFFVSFHIWERACEQLTSERSIEYFRQHEPIGCRDYFTQDLLKQKGVETYFSGCLTLTLRRSDVTERTDEILLVDLDEDVMQHILPHLLSRSVVLRHDRGMSTARISNQLYKYSPLLHKTIKATKVHIPFDKSREFVRSKQGETKRIQRFKEAEALLARYAQAKLVITSRLHCALPCLAFGTPVIFVNKDLKDPRFTGFLEYMRSYSPDEFKYQIKDMAVQSPEPNPKSIDKLREDLIRACEEFISDG